MRATLVSWMAWGGVIGILGAGMSRAEPPADRQGLVCFWDFDGSLDDRAGTAADRLSPREGKVRFVDAAAVPGVSGKAVALGVEPGDVQYLVAPASEDVKLGASYTIEAWALPTALSTWNRLVLRWGPEPEYAYHLAFHESRASFFHNQAGGRYLFAEGGPVQAGTVQAGRLVHLAAVARHDPARRDPARPSAGTLTVYLNGRAVATTPHDGTLKTLTGEQLGIGDSAGSPSPACRFRGYVDEVALWSRALRADEVAAHYARRAGLLADAERAFQQRQTALRAGLWGRLRRFGFEEIVFAQRAPGRDPAGHYYANFGYSCIDPTYWVHGEDGGSLCKWNLRTGELAVLLDDPGGAVRDPQVHFDGAKILFSYRKGGTHHYNLYEIGVDGTGLRQLTHGPWDDVEPAYLPDGDVVFCSSRAKRYIGCWLVPSATLHRCDAAGNNLRPVSSGSFTENTPAVLADGRVLYTRWEYVNRDPVSFHHLWTVNPDGTGQMVFLGNMEPGGVFIDAKPIPGGDRVVMIHSPGHGSNEHAGYVAVATGRHGPNGGPAMRHLSREPVFRDPYPLSEDAFLVARGNELLLMDSAGVVEVLYAGAGPPVHEPSPIAPRPRPPVLAPRSSPAGAQGTLVLADVYSGRAMAGVRRGAVRKLLVLEDLPKPANFHGGGSQPIGHGVTTTLKRILGTVPVEPDGSACFEVPAMRSVYFAALDAEDLSIKQMRSFVTLQPGETLACVGCHEPRGRTPRNGSRPVLQAMARPPSRIEPVAGVPAILDFPRDLQPILDRHCVACHNPGRRDGGVVLTGDRGPVFSLAYYDLLLSWQVKDTGGNPGHGSGRQPGNDMPYTTYSSASALMKKLDGGHYEARLAEQERRTVRLWIDAGAQYAGTYAAHGTGQVGGCWGNNEPVRVMADKWPSTPPAQEAVERRCGACHGRWLPRHVTDRTPLDPWGDMLSWERPLSRFSRHRIFNLTRPEHSLVLLAPLARQAGGYAQGEPPVPGAKVPAIVEDRSRPPQPVEHPVVFRDPGDPDYQKILAHVEAARHKLDEIKRFDMPGFKPNEHYVREMKRYGVLGASFELGRDPIDVYAVDAAYWRSLWHRPAPGVPAP